MQEERGGRKREESRVEGQQKKGGIGGGESLHEEKSLPSFLRHFITGSHKHHAGDECELLPENTENT